MSSASSYVPLDPLRYASTLNKRREPAALHSMMPLTRIPGMISFAGGMPNSKLFPFKQLGFTVADGTQLQLSPSELNDALQYCSTPGVSLVLQEVAALQQREHSPPYGSYGDKNGWSVSLGTGSSDVLTQAFDLLVDVGDTVLVEAPTYAGALPPLRPLQPNLVEVPVDAQGVIPHELARIIDRLEQEGRRKPKLLYVIPTGQNPAGCTLTVERKKEIYALACQHDFIILEDDPYWFLSYGPEKAPAEGSAEEANWQRPPNRSFLSMDTQGRVLRMDSFSKVLSSGMRLGMVTGPTALVQRMDLVLQASALHTSAVSQMLAYKLLNHWGVDGWNRHIREVCLFYARRRDVFVSLVEKHLHGMVTFTVPEAGMFVYFKLHGIANSKPFVLERAMKALVLMVPGQAFSPNNQISDCVRASFSTATDEDMDTALRRFAALLQEAVEEEAAATKIVFASPAASPAASPFESPSSSPSSTASTVPQQWPVTAADSVEGVSFGSQLFLPAPYALLLASDGAALSVQACAPTQQPAWTQQAASTEAEFAGAAGSPPVLPRRVRVSVAFAEQCAARLRSDSSLLAQMRTIAAQ